MVKPSKAFVPQAEDSPRKIFQVGSLFASLLSKRETDRILKFSLQCTKGKITKKIVKIQFDEFLNQNYKKNDKFVKIRIFVFPN